MRTLLFLIIIISVFVSCSNETTENKKHEIGKKEDVTSNKSKDFISLLGKFPEGKLPLLVKIDGGGMLMKDQFIIEPDSRYIGFFRDTNTYRTYRKFELPKRKIALISLYPADDWIPVLTIYDSIGNLLSREFLVQRGCHQDCGYIYCSSWIEIDVNFEMTLSDTLEYRICDENGIEGNREHFTLRTFGKIDPDGKIRFSEGESIVLK